MIKNELPGIFIVFEGIDGSGKSTQVKMLAEFLQSQGFKVITTHEPTDGKIGQMIKKVLKHKAKAEPFVLQRMFVSDRKNHLRYSIIPALKKGVAVICDRYILSTLAYAAVGLNEKQAAKLAKLQENLLWPNLTFLVDLTPEAAMERLKTYKKNLDLFEAKEKLTKIRKAYLALADNPAAPVNIIDGNPSPEKVFEKIKELVLLYLKIEKGPRPL